MGQTQPLKSRVAFPFKSVAPLCGAGGDDGPGSLPPGCCQAQEINVCQIMGSSGLTGGFSMSGLPFSTSLGRDLDLSRTRLHTCNGRFNFVELYELQLSIGSGFMGEVFLASERRAPQLASHQKLRGFGARRDATVLRSVAVKVFSLLPPPVDRNVAPCDTAAPPASPRRSGPSLESLRGSFETELAMLSQLEHPNIVRMYECFREQKRLLLVLEHCAGGELYEFVARVWRTSPHVEEAAVGLPEHQSQALFRQMLRAVSYIHSRHMVHRDIKTENFLILEPLGEKRDIFLKLCDFGSTAILTNECPRSLEKVGTPSYTAPEVYRNLGASYAADVWSLGVVLFMLITGTNPFRRTGREPQQVLLQRIVQGEIDKKTHIWHELSETSREFVLALIVVDESQRPTCREALCHQWLSPSSDSSSPSGIQFFAKDSPQMLPQGASVYAPELLALLSGFLRLDPLQRLLMTICARLTPDAYFFQADVMDVPWYELFSALDTDHDGCLSLVEFADGLERLVDLHSPELAPAYGRAHLEEMVRALDVDSSGAVDWCEWVSLALLSTGGSVVSVAPVRAALRALDAPTCDGRVSPGDLALLFGRGPICDRSQVAATALLQNWGFQQVGVEPSLDEDAAVRALLACYSVEL